MTQSHIIRLNIIIIILNNLYTKNNFNKRENNYLSLKRNSTYIFDKKIRIGNKQKLFDLINMFVSLYLLLRFKSN